MLSNDTTPNRQMSTLENPRLRKVDVPLGASGPWEVRRFTVDAEGAMYFNICNPTRRIRPGTYTQLVCDGDTWMSDTPAELKDHEVLLGEHLHGRVLINGLGLGVAVQAVLDTPDVDHLTVVEMSSHVIKLVGPHWVTRYGDRLEIVHADAMKYKPPCGTTYDVVFRNRGVITVLNDCPRKATKDGFNDVQKLGTSG